MAEIDEGVAGHGEGELSLADGFAFDGGDEEGAGIEDGDEAESQDWLSCWER